MGRSMYRPQAMSDRKQYYLSKKLGLLCRAIEAVFERDTVKKDAALNACKVIDQILETIELEAVTELEKGLKTMEEAISARKRKIL